MSTSGTNTFHSLKPLICVLLRKTTTLLTTYKCNRIRCFNYSLYIYIYTYILCIYCEVNCLCGSVG